MNFAQKKNLRIARFLNRVVFCFFAEDTGLLPKNLFSDIARTGIDEPKLFAETLEKLFAVMAKGGTFGKDKIRYFNGHLFEESTVFELTEAELRALATAGEADWQFIQPSIMGTLFERAMDESQRSQLGAHYTSEADIRTLVEPVLMAPLRHEWQTLKGELAAAYTKGKGTPAQRERLVKFQKKLSSVTVLDPACGSGNFLYVSLQLLLGLEKEVIAYATQLGFAFKPQVNAQQLRAIEINPYAFELAQVSVQIGYLQWRRDNGFDNDRTPVLQNLDGFQNEDALLVPHFRSKAKTLKEAQAGEHAGDDALKFYTEREWPEADAIVGNPPFLGDKLMRGELGDYYVEQLRQIYGERIPGQSDLCCYWFEKARQQIEAKRCERAGLLATQGIRGGGNREVLKRIKDTGDIFFAESDREWILNGATVHVSMVGFDRGLIKNRILNGKPETVIHANLTATADTTKAVPLANNSGVAFIGTTKGGDFDIAESEALSLLDSGGNPNGKPNSDVLKPILNGKDVLSRKPQRWLIDNADMPLNDACKYDQPHKLVVERVKIERDKNRDKWLRENWWKLQRVRPEMRAALAKVSRFIALPRVAKHRVCVWFQWPVVTDDQTVVFARDDDFFFGVVQSHIHEVWAYAQGTQVRERESGFRYRPTVCFETLPLPRPTPAQEAAIAAAAKELNELRERWLNPPEWTVEKFLEFPGSMAGPWSRYIEQSTIRTADSALRTPHSAIGLVRYPRLEPRDADCAAKLKKRTLTNLYNERPAWLDMAHKKLDQAVAAAYGWPADLTDEQILEKLLALNLERATEEAKAAKVKTPKAQRAKSADELV
jgi:type II restriction/modification system DNA methylase subunit YeeA